MKFDELSTEIRSIHVFSQRAAGRFVDTIHTLRNWLIGASIVVYEQNGEDRAEYGERLLLRLSEQFTEVEGKGLSARNLRNFRQFALSYPGIDIWQMLSAILGPNTVEGSGSGFDLRTLSLSTDVALSILAAKRAEVEDFEWRNFRWYSDLFTKLSFSHLLEFCRIDDPLRRSFYELECLESKWSVRELKRQISSMLFERVGLSKDRKATLLLAAQGKLEKSPRIMLRDPYVLEFLGLETRVSYSESELESGLLNHLQAFMHELGRDFCFIERQFRVTVGGRHHHIDLLFFHRSLGCLVAIDLKVGPFKHEYAGQMNFYLNYLKENVANPNESAPVGIILCADKDSEEVHYATAGLNESVFVSRYMLKLPSREQLASWLRQEYAVAGRSKI